MRVELPVARLRKGRNVPGVCAAHGEPATFRRSARYYSRPRPAVLSLLLIPALAAPLLLTGLLPLNLWGGRRPIVLIALGAPYLLAWVVTRSTLEVKRWPFCDRCHRRTGRYLIAALAMLLGGAIGAIAGFRLSSTGVFPAGGGFALIALVVVMPVGLGLLIASRYPRQPFGAITADGERLVLRGVHEEFAATVSPRIHVDDREPSDQ